MERGCLQAGRLKAGWLKGTALLRTKRLGGQGEGWQAGATHPQGRLEARTQALQPADKGERGQGDTSSHLASLQGTVPESEHCSPEPDGKGAGRSARNLKQPRGCEHQRAQPSPDRLDAHARKQRSPRKPARPPSRNSRLPQRLRGGAWSEGGGLNYHPKITTIFKSFFSIGSIQFSSG